MRKTSRVEKICTVCEKIGDIGDSVKGSSSRMKNKMGAQKGACIKMKQENMYIYQWLIWLCYVPIIAPLAHLPTSIKIYSSRLL
ncbi:hypothetical protein FHW74_004133 [Atlantibacter sp. RC6]|nr:hypothetical protein [Atlantibacter sp. RC6]